MQERNREMDNSVRKTFTLRSKALPLLELPSECYGLETILHDDTYFSKLSLEKATRTNTVLTWSDWELEPKPWKEVTTDLYYRCQGVFEDEVNYWFQGELEFRDSILKFKEKLEEKLHESEVIYNLETLAFKKDATWDWSNPDHQYQLLRNYLPRHLRHKRTRVIKEVTTSFQGFLNSGMKEVDKRFCIVINGNTGTQKTKLSKLIVKKMAASGLVRRSDSWAMWKQHDLTDKLSRTAGKEVVILDDYDGDNHKFGVLMLLLVKTTLNLESWVTMKVPASSRASLFLLLIS